MAANTPLTLTIQRAVHDKNFFRLLNRTAQDTTLSYGALGLLVSLLSRPTDWQVKVRSLVRSKAKRDAVYALLSELAAAGYVTLPTKRRNASGQWCWTPYLVHESPQPCPAQPNVASPTAADPKPDTPEIKTNDRPTNDRQTQAVVSMSMLEEADNGMTEAAQGSLTLSGKECAMDSAGGTTLRLALARFHVTPRLADQLMEQYGVARVRQVVRYMQQPANAGLGIGWLRSELKHPMSVPPNDCAVATLRTLEATDSEMSPDHSLSSMATPVTDPSIAFRVNTQHSAASLWKMVAHQLVLKGFREIRSATLVAYDSVTQTYTVRVSSKNIAQQLTRRYGKHVQSTLTGLHPKARVVFVPSGAPQSIS
jgi:hypothetical protein